MRRNGAIIVISTVAGIRAAHTMARALVRTRLAACCSYFPVRSQYVWRGKHQSSREVMLMIKTTAHRYQAVETFIKKHHPYQVPEIIAVPVTHAEGKYLNWIMKGVS